jgi:hypothetical protein
MNRSDIKLRVEQLMMMTIGIGLCRPFISFYFVTKIITSWLLTMTIINGCPINNYVPKWSKFDNYALEWWKFGFFFFVLFWKVVALANIVWWTRFLWWPLFFFERLHWFFPARQHNVHLCIFYKVILFTFSWPKYFSSFFIFLSKPWNDVLHELEEGSNKKLTD